MTPRPIFTPTAADVAEARRAVSVALACVDDVLARTLPRRAAWNVLRTDLAQRRNIPTATGGHAA